MSTLLATLFVSPISLTGFGRLILMLPLCLSIAIVYKATRSERLSDVPAAALTLWITIVMGMVAVGVALWLIYLLVA